MSAIEVPSVAEVAADVVGVLERFRSGRTFPFSFGDGKPEAVMLTYDQFKDLDGDKRFERYPGVLPPEALARHLTAMVEAIRGEAFAPVVWGRDGEAEAVVMSTSQYRDLRGDDTPPAGVDDDPTRRVYATEPLPNSRAMSLDQIAELMGPEAVEDLRGMRRDDPEGP
jgi:hypothetical protein